MWLTVAYDWLVHNALWQSVIAWAVFTGLTTAVAWVPWKRHRKEQQAILRALTAPRRTDDEADR